MNSDSVSTDDVRQIAKHFRRLKVVAPDAEPFYEMLSDAIVWTDELPRSSPEKWWFIRPVLHHRTCVLISRPSEFEHLWIAAKDSFPEWIGFAPDRCTPTEALQKLYVEGFARMQREFDELLGA